ncbi:hypothetical protein IVA78_26600 [Bradyrhizobium sp. 137]|uniref:alpha/beta hydrolase family protein n=1 Tax=Bradyrhizobium sp. 137 TaxID=2782614 RepID=UPI001FFB3DE4|nr:hypothetical protein [Bradyrhizobium sp. 137]MCK1758647.1 hypothetical protein [Bradyrhizobium sp. 137]
MLCVAWPEVTDNLESTRRSAALFLDSFSGNYEATSRRHFVARWTNIGDAHCLFGDLNVERGALDAAAEACALTAFEVARRLVDENDPQAREVLAKLEAGIGNFGSLEQRVRRVEIASWDERKLPAYYVSAGGPGLRAPAVICMSREDETGATLLGRLLPVIASRGMAALVVAYDDVSASQHEQSEILSCCLDYLSARQEVDASRIGIYGDGLSAALATDFALADRRIAAAVCDGGLWKWARTQASISWMTGTSHVLDDHLASAHRSRLARRLKCPILVVAGGHSIVSVPEGIKLESDCATARVDLKLLMSRLAPISDGEFENFAACDEDIFAWLEQKLARTSAS